MDKLTKYRQYIQQLLTEESQGKTLGGDIESEIIFDLVNDRYLLIDLGWNEHRRIYNCVLHLEIREEKIWIQRNQTDTLIADTLIAKGVAKDDIVLGLQPPYMREYSGFGVS
ncbi:fdxN element excision controlling factor protein [Anabaenopsis circularis NIES-21]|uniref:FdxN element excision controlling factor protein n=1 Tax=Anabaenopsis circularis NIES-21 TaxID=1085406 RepID=A0A1Z4GFP5_9CYAN|nr:fdxN element excision controlling factor protein [Anabaenopsis circularis NIES-21]